MAHKFDFTIDGKPDYSLLTVKIPAGEKLMVEASAMASMDTNIKMKTKMKGGLRRMLTKESLFINEFSAEGQEGEIKIAPNALGDLEHVYLDNNVVYLQSSAYCAASPTVETDVKFDGLKGFFTGEGLFFIKCSGQGDLWFNSYGAIYEIDVSGSYVIDTGHIVGFTEGLEHTVTSVGGYKSLFLSGEGLVCKFFGEGKVWIQTRKVMPFTSWVNPFRPVKKKK
ncbi:MAG: TIGR00266 family protein [Bacteroidales bacterium]|nr:TIGR00266 family protein [Bacteroidales bacterium]